MRGAAAGSNRLRPLASNSGMRKLVVALAFLLATPAVADAGGESEPPVERTPVSSGAPCVVELTDRVQAHYEGVRDLHAGFVQRQRSVVFGGSAEEQPAARGEVWFAKPGRMRWSYREPEPSEVVTDGKTLWIYDPTAAEVQVLPVDEGFLSGAGFQFLLGEGRIRDSFQVTTEDCHLETARLTLTPRAESTYELLHLWVATGSGAVEQTEVADLFGNRTRVTFEGVETNQDPSDEFFRFDPPEGVRVLELTRP